MISKAVLATWSPRMLSVLRIVAALLFLQHGLATSYPPRGPRAPRSGALEIAISPVKG
jgi:hypothetical protein